MSRDGRRFTAAPRWRRTAGSTTRRWRGCTQGTRLSSGVTAAVLVVHPGALGDVLLAVPALRALQSCHHGEPVVLAAQPHIGALLGALGAVDLARPFDSLGLEPLFVDDGAPARVAAITDAARVIC